MIFEPLFMDNKELDWRSDFHVDWFVMRKFRILK